MSTPGVIEITDDFAAECMQVYDKGFPDGVHCGFADVPLKLIRKRLCLLTGIPSSGKSNWLDCVMLNTAASDGWHWVVFSPENSPVQRHVANLSEKIAGKPYFAGHKTRMTREEAAQALTIIRRHFTFISPTDDTSPNVKSITELIGGVISKRRKAGLDVHGVVLDPFNEMDHSRSVFEGTKNMSETEYISHFLSYLRNWSKRADVFACLVAHPTKLQKMHPAALKAAVGDGDTGNVNPYPCPTPYDIAGSSHFRNKADICVSVHRPLIRGTEVEIHVQKVRFREDGEVGVSDLLYVSESASYTDNFDVAPDVSFAAFAPKQQELNMEVPF